MPSRIRKQFTLVPPKKTANISSIQYITIHDRILESFLFPKRRRLAALTYSSSACRPFSIVDNGLKTENRRHDSTKSLLTSLTRPPLQVEVNEVDFVPLENRCRSLIMTKNHNVTKQQKS
jgi:hypothetical protein